MPTHEPISGRMLTRTASALLSILSVLALPACSTHAPPAPPASAPIATAMVTLPGGTFVMGSPDGVGDKQEHPQHRVTVAPFQLDRTLVTVNAYGACVHAGACSPASTEQRGSPGSGPDEDAFCNGARADRGDHPINCVDWEQANAYCHWAGERLPTEEEWEYGARAPDDRLYPWGSDAPAGHACWNRWKDEDHAHARGTCPVGAFASGDSAFGVHDMVGNVWVWTSTVWSVAYGGPIDATARVVRGGGWRDTQSSVFRGANRNGSDLPDRVVNLGFRCAR